jgi:hypothetical protein
MSGVIPNKMLIEFIEACINNKDKSSINNMNLVDKMINDFYQ